MFAKAASTGVQSFFVGDRKLSWWVAGTSIVATTFAADTPLAVTGIVASGGISGNWLWWSWGIAHLTATFFFARMWRRSGVITDAEITEVRYSGKPAAFLRGFKAIYFGIFINCLTMAWVIAAMVKISRAFFDVHPATVIVLCVSVSVVYTTLGGFRSVVFSDVAQFVLGMFGAIVLAYVAVQHFGGLGAPAAEGAAAGSGHGLIGQLEAVTHAAGRNLADALDFVPSAEHATTPRLLFVVLLIAGWWRYAEGNGYIVQRLAACRDEGHAQGASLWFSVAHNALRPWPWILVALAALVLYPMAPADRPEQLHSVSGQLTLQPSQLDSVTGGTLMVDADELQDGATITLNGYTTNLERADGKQWRADFTSHALASAYPDGPAADPLQRVTIVSGAREWQVDGLFVGLTDREMGYPVLMGQFLPPGLLGLVIASLLAAFMSTIDTHTNWGASYLVRDIYQRFIRPDADERHCVMVSRLCIVLMAALAGVSALIITNIGEVWRFLVMLGAGLGSVTAARWYWSRVTAWAEIAAMSVTTVSALFLLVFCTPTLFGGDNPWFWFPVDRWAQIVIIAGVSLATWIPVSLLGPKEDAAKLKQFAELVRPPGPGWKPHWHNAQGGLGGDTARFAAGLVVVYGTLFGIGELLLGSTLQGCLWLAITPPVLMWVVRSAQQPES